MIFIEWDYFKLLSFTKQEKKYKNLKNNIEIKIKYLLYDPYNSEQLKANLRGLRSVRLTKNFRIIFCICEECMKDELYDKNIKFCKKCLKDKPHSIILITFGQHKDIYKI